VNSLERSLRIGLAITVVLLMLVLGWGGTLTTRLLTESALHARLAADADSVRDAWLPLGAASANGWPGQPVLRLYPEYDRPASGRYWAMRFADGRRVSSRSAWEQDLSVPDLLPGVVERGRVSGSAGEPLVFWAGGYVANGQRVTIAVARQVSDIDDRLASLRVLLLAFSLVLLCLVLLVQRTIVQRAFARLDALRADVERLGHGEITALPEEVPEEVRPLVLEFNRLLSRFDQRLQQSRNAVGNLAHALKGPLNLLVRAADQAAAIDTGRHGADSDGRGSDGTASDDMAGGDTPGTAARGASSAGAGGSALKGGVADQVRHGAERIRQLIEAELRRARLVGRTSVGRRFDLDAEVQALAGLLRQVYAEKDVEVRLAIGADVSIVHDRQDMLELIGNLIDNAVKWADALVMVSVRQADGLLMEIEDDGPGVSDEAVRELARRGVRLDESVAGDGLGLAIVRDIAASYGGTLELGRSNRLGGFRAAVRLPDRPAPGSSA